MNQKTSYRDNQNYPFAFLSCFVRQKFLKQRLQYVIFHNNVTS